MQKLAQLRLGLANQEVARSINLTRPWGLIRASKLKIQLPLRHEEAQRQQQNVQVLLHQKL